MTQSYTEHMGVQSDQRAAREHYLDVLRGMAALAVLVSHADHAGLIEHGMSSLEKGLLGRAGVTVFFILSGFLIWTAARRLAEPGGLQRYAIHRATRLLPLYWANLAFAMWVLPHLDSAWQSTPSIETLVRHLTFTQALSPAVDRDLNPVLWTLTHEAIFYALVPLLVRVSPRALALMGLATLLGARYVPVIGTFLLFFHLFVVGILLAERRPAHALLWSLIYTGAYFVQSTAALAALTMLSAGLVVSALLLPGRCLRLTAPLRWVGEISFSLYAWHYLLINLIGTEQGIRWLSRNMGKYYQYVSVRALVVLAILLAIAWVSYRLIERPGMTSSRRALEARFTRPDSRNLASG